MHCSSRVPNRFCNICQLLFLPPVHRIDCNVSERWGNSLEKSHLHIIAKSICNTLFAMRWNAYSFSVTVLNFICTSMCVVALSKGLRNALPISEKPKLAWLEL